MKVLIVDDEKNIVDLIQKNLKLEGYETLGAYSGCEAIHKVKTEKTDIKNLNELKESVCMIQSGSPVKNIDIRSGDEIEELGKAFNDMQNRIG